MRAVAAAMLVFPTPPFPVYRRIRVIETLDPRGSPKGYSGDRT
jgi:hypothetical protein